MKSLLERPEETPLTQWEETSPSPRDHHALGRKRSLLITLALLLLMVVLGSLLLNQAITKNSSRPPPSLDSTPLSGHGSF